MAWRKENFGAARTTTNRAYSRRKPRQIVARWDGQEGRPEDEHKK